MLVVLVTDNEGFAVYPFLSNVLDISLILHYLNMPMFCLEIILNFLSITILPYESKGNPVDLLFF